MAMSAQIYEWNTYKVLYVMEKIVISELNIIKLTNSDFYSIYVAQENCAILQNNSYPEVMTILDLTERERK
jgi:hypothetical protein